MGDKFFNIIVTICRVILLICVAMTAFLFVVAFINMVRMCFAYVG